MRSRLRDARRKAQDLLSAVDRLADFIPKRAAGVVKGHPRLNMHEEPDRYVYRAELPGVRREDLELTMQGRQVTIAGEKRRPDCEGQPRKQERPYGRFNRTVTLPEDADVEAEPEATLKNGILVLSVPRRGEQVAKHVEVGGEKETESSVSVGEESADESDAEQSE
jgi:HSP20 family protein